MSRLESTHKFYAFISYSRKDVRLAKQLESTLTRFNLPAELCEKYPQKPKKLRPVFRDIDDLKTGELTGALAQALRDSKFLIVICSEHSAKVNLEGKNWIDVEVKTFIRILAENQDLPWSSDDVENLIRLLDLINIKDPAEREKNLVACCQVNAIEYDESSIKKWGKTFSKSTSEWKRDNFKDLALLLGYPHYGEEELQAIKSLLSEMQERIIPVIHRPSSLALKLGIKKGLRTSDCMPPSIKKLNFVTYDIQVQGKWRVFNNVIASMLGLDLDELWNRYGKWLRLKMRIKFTFITTIILLLLGGGAFAYDYCVPKIEYYIDYGECYNLPQGIGKLSEEEIKTRFGHYKFTYQYYKLQSVESCNSYGELTDTPFIDSIKKRAAKIVFSEYNDKGHVSESLHYDSKGALIAKVRYPSLDEIVYKKIHSGQSIVTGYTDSLYQLRPDNQNEDFFDEQDPVYKANRYYVKRDEKGRVQQEMSYCGEKQHCLNEDGVWGYSFTYDELNRIRTIRYIDEEGNIMHRKGIVGKNIDYADCYPVLEYFVDIDGKERPKNGEAWSRIVTEWDKGNPISVTFKTPEEKAVYSSVIGAASGHCLFNENDGTLSELSYKDEKGENVVSTITGVHAIKFNYIRSNGVVIEEMRCYNEKMEPETISGISTNAAYSVQEITDPYNKLIRTIYFDKKDKVVHTVECYYDADWRLLYETGKDKELKLCYEYDSNGDFSSSYYVNTKGQVCKGPQGYARNMWTFDPISGDVRSISYFDENSKPCLNETGEAKCVFTHELLAEYNHIRKNYSIYVIDPSDPSKLILDQMNIFTLNKEGYVVGVEYRDANRNLKARGSSGVAAVEIQRNGENSLSILYKNQENMPLIQKRDIQELLPNELNHFGELVKDILSKEVEYCGQKIEKTWKSDGGVEIKMQFLDAGRQILSKEGEYVGYILEYDSRKRINRIVLLEAAENGEVNKFARLNLSYHAGNHIIFEYFNRSNVLINKSDCFLTQDGTALINGPEGYAMHCKLFDNQGELLNEFYMNKNHKPVNGPEGYAMHCKLFDNQGELLNESYMNMNHKLVNGPEGYALFMIYQENNTSIGTYTTADAKAVNGPKGYAYHSKLFDNQGKLLIETYRNKDDELVKGPEGYALYSYTCDDNGKITERYFDDKDMLTIGPRGYAVHLSIESKETCLIKEIFLNAENKLCKSVDGYAVYACQKDDKGNIIWERYFDEHTQLCNGLQGYAEHAFIRDEKGRVIDESYFTADGTYTDGPDGYAVHKMRYDETGKLIDEVYVDETLMKKNEQGKIIEILYRDAHGALRGNFDGIYKKCFEWSADGTQILKTYNYDEDGNIIE